MEEEGRFALRWIILAVSFITLALTSTVIYTFSIFYVSILKEFGWSRSITAGAFSLFWMVYGIIGPFAGNIVDRLGPRRVFVLGSLLVGAGFALCSMIHSWWQFYIFFGVIAAMGAGATGWVSNATVIQNWFKEERGLAIGILSSGVGIGIFICVPVIQHLINRVEWRITYRIMAFSIPLIVTTLAVVFLKNHSRKRPSPRAEEGTFRAATKDPRAVDREWTSRAWTLQQAIRTKQFWVLSVSFFSSTMITQSILTHHVVFFVDGGMEALLASYIVGMIGIVSIGGKIFWGALSDRVGREVTYTLGSACTVCGMVLLIFFALFPFPSLPYLYALLFGMGYAGMTALPPLITADFFEGRTYGSIFGTIFILNCVGGAFGAWFGGFLYDHVGSYIPFFAIMIIFSLLACLNIWIAAPRKIRIVPGKRSPGRVIEVK